MLCRVRALKSPVRELKSPVRARGPRCAYDHAERSSGCLSRASQESLISVRNKERIAGEGSNKSARKEPCMVIREFFGDGADALYIFQLDGDIFRKGVLFIYFIR